MFFSYDIFDTILFRKVPKSTDIFIIMEEKLRDVWDPNKLGSFSNTRRKVEFWLRRFSKGEITIEDIYGKIREKTQLSEEIIRQIENIEFETEIENSFLDNRIVCEIKQKIKDGANVVLISDMYWHEEQIRGLLSEKDAVFSNLPIYVSCDYGVTKKTGRLFKLVKEKENINYSSWIHTGDNRKSDGSAAEEIGIKSLIVKGNRKYDFERNLNIRDKDILKTYGVIKESLAISNGDAYDFGAAIVAPMVYQYVEWVIREAATKGIEALYFVLRDGFILKEVADIIIEQKKYKIHTQYIYGSRVAWRFPEITVDKLKNLSIWEKSNWIFRDPAVAYVPFERLGFSKEKVDELLGDGYGERIINSFAEFKTILNECLQNEGFVTQLEENISRARELLDSYIKETIDFSESFALVDTNSTGKTQSDLNRMLKRINPEFSGLRFFYHTFLADEELDKETQFVFFNSKQADRRFPEAFFRAPYNQCYGYQVIDGKTKPKFHESEKCAWNYSFDYDSYLNGILEFTRHINDINVDAYVEILLRVVNFDIISKDEIEQAAKMPFNPDINGDEILDFYPEMKNRSLLHPFSELIYYPKGSYYAAGRAWIVLYKLLSFLVKIKRKGMKG